MFCDNIRHKTSKTIREKWQKLQRTWNVLTETQEVINLVNDDDGDNIVVLTAPENPIKISNVRVPAPSKTPSNPKFVHEPYLEIIRIKSTFFQKPIAIIAKMLRKKKHFS